MRRSGADPDTGYPGDPGDPGEPGDDAEALMSVPPERIRRQPRLLYARRADEVPAKALAYARDGTTRTYDDIAYRYLCACPQVPFLGVETLAGLAVRERRERRMRPPDDVTRLAEQRDYLAHRHLVPPDGTGRVAVERGLLYVMAEPGGEIVGRFPPAVPNRTLDDIAQPADVRPQPAGRLSRHLADSRWLPLDALIGYGRFPAMREAGPRLARGIGPGCHHVFVSHRWMDAERPDPDGIQARLIAWHLVAALCEAVRVAHRRGLHTPRRWARAPMNMPVGTAGSDLAESLLVGVLRENLDEASLEPVAREVERVDVDEIGTGAARAADDAGPDRLRALLDTVPALRPLLRRIRLWYDYSCVPQAPHTPEEQVLFRRTLASLPLLQAAGRTLILLDDVADYLGRAWCGLEAATSLKQTVGERPDVLFVAGAARQPGPVTDSESLRNLVLDRQLVVWRGLLDTELFRSQTREECLRRLGLSMTDPRDLPHIYDRMLSVSVPNGRMSRQALVTGVVPLPDLGGGRMLIPAPDYQDSQPVDGRRPLRVIGSLDWWGGLDLRRFTQERRADAGPPDVPPYWSLPNPDPNPDPHPNANRKGGPPRCHVAVVAECEGEAALISSWVRQQRADLEKLLHVTVVSGSWTAVDPVPVGHLPHGRLRARPVRADVWVVVGKSGPVSNGVGQALCRVAHEARLPTVTVSLDLSAENVAQVVGDVAPGAPHSAVLSGWTDGHEHRAGLLYMHLYRHLLQWGAPVR
ncbi:hypothetical protein [Streptomyces sp. I05A-00742]|uniref:hypothetical protein n=1 Tax=Streptomyces sp. I05A-00742 TaxID=2732853 RepID=UPI00148847FB|nr:hypothetical protein [Streptomyces sp. I05A-00742]